MIDLEHLEQYKENNRIEAKKALGGLPHSIWETYSAFANTLGGVILLGVAEYDDKSLHTVDLPDPEKLVREFRDILNDPRKTGVNLLSSDDVTIENVGGDHIIVIRVPRAQRYYKPVFVDGDPLNVYRRGGEGDYRCTKEEYDAMVRDASAQTQDMTILDDMMPDVLLKESIRGYRRRMSAARPGHAWEKLGDEELLFCLGALAIGKDGKKHPTAAGLLMFGSEHDIILEYPMYFLDYREECAGSTERFLSASGDWSGNIFDFYCHVYDKLIDGAPAAGAVGEALANCLINADYYGRGGIVVVKGANEIKFANPGELRIEEAAARSGGFSDPRNSIIMKMFHLIGIGECAGNGIPNIFYVWKSQGLREPVIAHTCSPERVELTLPLTKSGEKKTNGKTEIQKAMIIEYLTDHADASVSQLCALLGVKDSRVRQLMRALTEENIVVSLGGKGGRYKLRS